MNYQWYFVMRRWLLLLLIIGLLGGCATRQMEPPLPQQNVVRPPQVNIDNISGEHSITVDVLIYNVAALPWPILANRTRALRLIGAELAEMRKLNIEPDIVLIQEGFRRTIKYMIADSGYPNWVRGPKTGDKMPKFSPRAPEAFKHERKFWKGERLGKIMDSGLYILSNWPILTKQTQPFYRYECAGFDCGSNKGILGAAIEVPNMPGYLQLFTTHMNARGSTGVSEQRSLQAHNLQIDHLDEYIDTHWSSDHPLIFGGDFNMKEARERLDYASGRILKPYDIVQHYCTVIDLECEVRMSYDSDEPWLDTNDLQGWASGSQVKVKAIMVEALFDEPHPQAPKIKGTRNLSDHDGLLVRYRLSWNPSE